MCSTLLISAVTRYNRARWIWPQLPRSKRCACRCSAAPRGTSVAWY